TARSSAGRTVRPSRSWLAAASIACTRSARVIFPWCRANWWRICAVSICTRYTGPYPYSPSEAENSGAGLLFQLSKNPCGGAVSCTRLARGGKPSHPAPPGAPGGGVGGGGGGGAAGRARAGEGEAVLCRGGRAHG